MSIKREIKFPIASNTKADSSSMAGVPSKKVWDSRTPLLVPILWLAIFPATVLGTHALWTHSRPEKILSNLSVTLGQVETIPPSDQQVELEQKKFKLSLIVSIIVIVIFFLAILLMTIIRQGRFYRKRLGLGDKSKPTRDIDAWTDYRLKDDLDKKD